MTFRGARTCCVRRARPRTPSSTRGRTSASRAVRCGRREAGRSRPYCPRRREAHAAGDVADGVEVSRVSLDLLRVSRRVADARAAAGLLRGAANFPALLWLRLRGMSVIARLGRHHRRGAIASCGAGASIRGRSLVANSPFTRRELMAHGIDGDKIETIEHGAAAGLHAAAGGEAHSRRRGDLRRPDHFRARDDWTSCSTRWAAPQPRCRRRWTCGRRD